MTSCGSKATYNNTSPENPTVTTNPVGQNSIGIAGELLLSGGLTQSEHYDLHAYITPYAGTVLTATHFQISDMTLQNRFAPGEVQ